MKNRGQAECVRQSVMPARNYARRDSRVRTDGTYQRLYRSEGEYFAPRRPVRVTYDAPVFRTRDQWRTIRGAGSRYYY